MGSKRTLTHTLKLWREQGDDHQVAQALIHLSDTNRLMGLCEERAQQAMEVLEIYIHKRLGDTLNQVKCLIDLALTLHGNIQLNTAEEVASRAIKLLPEKGQQLKLCQGYHILGDVYCSKGDVGREIHHFEVALGIATSLNLSQEQFWVHISLSNIVFRDTRVRRRTRSRRTGQVACAQ